MIYERALNQVDTLVGRLQDANSGLVKLDRNKLVSEIGHQLQYIKRDIFSDKHSDEAVVDDLKAYRAIEDRYRMARQ